MNQTTIVKAPYESFRRYKRKVFKSKYLSLYLDFTIKIVKTNAAAFFSYSLLFYLTHPFLPFLQAGN